MFLFSNLNFDFDGDGVLDSHADFMDLDGSGVADYAEIDFDGDGNADAVIYDTNKDGTWDAGLIDSDSDGIADMSVFDLDGDGVIDSFGMDSNGDGIIDTYHTELDTDHDGIIDTVIESSEAVEIYHIDAGTGLGYIEAEPTGVVSGTYVDELGNFNPADADMDRVSGDPESAMEEWEYQGDTGRCALYAQKFVIEELTDAEIDMEELARLAEENGWYSEDSGTSILNMDKVLDYYGIDSDMSFQNDIEDIQECLESGGKIIVAIDADEIWYGENDDLFTPGDGANHAVEVIGIDRTDTDEPMVILNDSGNPNGCGEMVPLETFLDAWEDSNCQMIACMGAYQG